MAECPYFKSADLIAQLVENQIIRFAGNGNETQTDVQRLKDLISFGGSPRASISLSMAAKAYAFIKRRGYVIPEDVRAVCPEVLRHRIGLTYEAEAENVTTEELISDIVNAVIVP